MLKKMKNGLHDIQSNVFLINLYDTIKIFKTKAKKDTVIFKGPFNKLVNRKNNSILKTLKILRLNKIINSSYKVIVNKKIPVFLFHMYVLCSNIQEQYKYFYQFFQSSGFEWGLRVPCTRSCRSHHRKLLLSAQLRENWRGQNPKRLQNEGQLPESSGQDRTAVELLEICINVSTTILCMMEKRQTDETWMIHSPSVY